MTNLEAREILASHRPGGHLEEDPRIVEAFRQAQADPELAHWYQNHCAACAILRAKLKSIPVPPDLKRRILHQPPAEKIITLRAAYMPLAIAAGILIIAAGALAWTLFPKGDSFAAYQDRVVRQSQRGYAMSMTSTNLADIREYLKIKGWDAGYKMTAKLEKLPGEGCATWEWHGRKVAMVCINGGKDNDLYLFVVDNSGLQNLPPSGAAQFSRIHHLTAASWTEQGRTYVLAGPGGEADIRKYLD